MWPRRGCCLIAGDRELVSLAHQLRATALLERGDPAGRDELLAFITLAGQLGHARGRSHGPSRIFRLG